MNFFSPAFDVEFEINLSFVVAKLVSPFPFFVIRVLVGGGDGDVDDDDDDEDEKGVEDSKENSSARFSSANS